MSARGLLAFTSGAKFNVASTAGSAGTNGANGNSGAGGGGPSGSTNPNGGAGGGCILGWCGGTGGTGGWGGGGGSGGTGGAGGKGGNGGTGGAGAPGMVKLHGSIVEASSASVDCNNQTTSTDTNFQGRFTTISNMTAAKLASGMPSFNDNIVTGATTHPSVLTAPSVYNAGLYTPLIPTLTDGPATAGFARSDYWNKSRVNAALAAVSPQQLIERVKLTGDFEGYEQYFLVNTSATDTAAQVSFTVNGYAPIPIGFMTAGQVWTILVPVGTAVSHAFVLDIGPQISVTGYPIDFNVNETGTGLTGSQRIFVQNTGTRDLTINSVSIGGVHPSSFQVTGSALLSPLTPGGSGFVDVAFDTAYPGEKFGSLIIVSNALNAPTVTADMTGIADRKPTITTSTPAVTEEAASGQGASVTLHVHTEDADGDALTVTWEVDSVIVKTEIVAAGGPPSAADLSLTQMFAKGAHAVRVTSFDGYEGQQSEVVMSVTVTDTTPPVITLNGTSPVTIEVGAAYFDAGATASDLYDGDLTGQIVTQNNVVPSTVGSYTISYDVQDSSGNAAAQIVRVVHVVDTTAPVITLLGASPVTVEVHGAYSDAGATALDNYDGDLTGSIVAVSNVNVDVVGSYTVTYDVTDAAGNAASQVVRTVNVVDTTAPVITLLGASPVTVEVHGAYSDAGA
ncbi:MAG TPA: DUF5011 domain-containing protein, partial [Candidatus Hydrogenedentes bacterium]|nr:DUF5011 domain-containing protein [Candidatus Hydrogenedentota bacterium]